MPPRSKDHARLGEAVKQIREAKGLKQTEVAAAMDAPPTFLSDIERGIRNPSLSTLYALAGGLGVTLSELFKRAGQ